MAPSLFSRTSFVFSILSALLFTLLYIYSPQFHIQFPYFRSTLQTPCLHSLQISQDNTFNYCNYHQFENIWNEEQLGTTVTCVSLRIA